MKTLGIVVSTLLIGMSVACSVYAESRDSTEEVLEIINNNERIAQFFSTPVTKDQVSQVKESSNPKDNTLFKNITLHVSNANKSADVSAILVEEEAGTAAAAIALTDSAGKKTDYIDASIVTSAYTDAELDKKGNLADYDDILTKVISENGHFQILRSKNNNDYMQTWAYDDDGKKCMILEYSQGFTHENKQMYRADDECLTKEAVLSQLLSYVGGTDKFKSAIKWKPLKEIKTNDKGKEVYIYE